MTATPCTDCGTTAGSCVHGTNRPKRYNGIPYGVAGQICVTCRARRLRALAVAASLCDLCGQPSQGRTHEGAEFDIEGRICGDCHEELCFERAEERQRELAESPFCHGGFAHGVSRLQASARLRVLDGRFTVRDMTLRAQCRLMVVEANRRERRAS